MKLSIVIPVLNSHEILRRQVLYWEKNGIPGDTEIIIVDDGSDPPLTIDSRLPITLIQTNDKRPWTWALARNKGARLAQGEYLFMVDLDFIIPREAMEMACGCTEDKMCVEREFGVLDEYGNFTQDLDVLKSYGLMEERVKDRGIKIPPHSNMFIMRKKVFWDLKGYREDLVGREYPQGEDNNFKQKWAKHYEKGLATLSPKRPLIYMFPNGKYCGDVDFNPHGLFHGLSRKTEKNPFYKEG